ncbi:arsenate reductase [Roseovarius sp. A-2]|uniref:arsenate reductase (glutaredoxin) n=1 Tax=Roseovarius sp. A-2 TaxID=1570360 RepID=UPI0009B55F77|nr:arsenate reductase (glutaredoxin) [Roseovarius sp. A-2]GAW35978.1 arsenate reductase [Roseovarius sp. A-2]
MITYWHNPRCSKSRAGLKLLEERGAEVNVRRYLEDAPTEAELRDVLARLEVAPIEMMRSGEARFKDLGLTRDSDPETLIAAMTENPILIERPIGVTSDQAVIGRPPERLLSLL